jgi:hypothetical protein
LKSNLGDAAMQLIADESREIPLPRRNANSLGDLMPLRRRLTGPVLDSFRIGQHAMVRGGQERA